MDLSGRWTIFKVWTSPGPSGQQIGKQIYQANQ